MNNRYRNLSIYIGKTIAGILLCFLASHFFEWIDYSWSMISVVLVLSPEGKDALELIITRIKANFVGAGVGMLFLFLQVPNPYNIAAGALISLFICDKLNLNAGARSTLAAMIIILLHKEGSHLWDAAFTRISAVVVGCLIGLLVTYIFHSVFKINTLSENTNPAKSEQQKEA